MAKTAGDVEQSEAGVDAREAISRALENGVNLLPEDEGKRLMAEYGIAIPEGRRIASVSEAKIACDLLGYPLVLKALVPGLAHKTDRGAVTLNLGDWPAVRGAVIDMSRRFPKSSLLIERMEGGGVELIAGLVDDPQMGPCLMIGTGGIFTEILSDVEFLLLPATREDIAAALSRLKGHRLLSGFRGSRPCNVEKLLDSLQALSKFGVDAEGCYDAVDINPLLVTDVATIALDAKVVLKTAGKSDGPSGARPLEPRAWPTEGFFEPRSVAIVGASPTPGKPGYTVVENLLANGYAGAIYPVNPKGGEILGLPVTSRAVDLPLGIDLAVIIVPSKQTASALRDVASRGIKHVVLSAGGFAETSEEGAGIQQELLEILQDNGMSALGPNTSGHISTPSRLTSTFFPVGKVRGGNISYIAQTGNFATFSLKYILTAEHFGISRVIGLGNKIDVEESQALAYLGDDPETRAIAMYLESIKYPRNFLKVARKVTRKKPVVMLKGGATTAGKQAASAHTAALAAEDRIVDGLLRQAGITRIHDYSQLVLAGKALSMCNLPAGNRVGFMAPSGAMLVVLSDLCTRLGLDLPSVEDATLERIQEISPPFIRIRNPVDIWAAALAHGFTMAYSTAIDALLGDPNIDMVVAIFMLAREMGVPDDFSFVPRLARLYPNKPLLVSFTGDKECMDLCRAALEPSGVPTFMQIEEPFQALSILARCGEAMRTPRGEERQSSRSGVMD